jgi:transcriptional regulator with XRE-family HTH domain
MALGQRIKQARKAGNLSQRDLAKQAGVSPMAISKYERDLDLPGSGVLLRLAQALGVPIDFFFRPATAAVQLQAYRKHAALGVKEQEAIRMRIQEWLERYLEVESLFQDEQRPFALPVHAVQQLDQAEEAAVNLRQAWNLGLDPLGEPDPTARGSRVKVGLVSGFDHFDACLNGNGAGEICFP